MGALITKMIEITEEQYRTEAIRRFGHDPMHWRFVCPVCGFVASTADYKDAGAPQSAVAFSCVGRWLDNPRRAFGDIGPGPCDYSGGGLFGCNPVCVTMNSGKKVYLFSLADPETEVSL